MESGESGDCMSKPKDDLISRAAALDAIDCWHIDFNSMDGAKVQTDCWRTIKELPAVNAVPVVHGRWNHIEMYEGHAMGECSNCLKLRIVDNFCPNCGARMDGESNG